MVEFTQAEKSNSKPTIPSKPISPGVGNDIPNELKEQQRWIVWKYTLVRNGAGEPRWTKVPFQAWIDDGVPHQKAKSDDPGSWSSFADALAFYNRHREELDGVGFMLKSSGYTGIDFDHCLDGSSLDPWVQCQIDKFGSYSDVSPSNTGVKMLVRGTVASKGRRNSRVEFYPDTEGRFFTITGRSLPGTPLEIAFRQDALDAFLTSEFPPEVPKSSTASGSSSVAPDDEDVWSVIRAARNGSEVVRLYRGDWNWKYGSQSEADLALCSHLAFWLGGDENRIDEWFRRSGLMRDKWDSLRGGLTYGETTINQVLGREVYQWPSDAEDKAVEAMFAGKVPVASVPTDRPVEAPADDEDKYARMHREAAGKSKPADPRRERRGLTADEIERLPSPEWLVRRHITNQSLTILAGPPGAGKSYLALSISLSIATGTTLFDQFKVRRGRVAYIYSEGESGLKYRLRAWRQFHGVDKIPLDFRAYPYRYNLLDKTEAESIVKQMYHDFDGDMPDLVVVDTLARNYGPGDENSTKDMNAFVESLDIIRAVGVAVTVIHHTGKDAGRGERGSTALRGAADTVILAVQDETGLCLRCDKMKDGSPFSPYVVRFVPQVVGRDSEGEEVVSAALEYIGDKQETKEAAAATKLDGKFEKLRLAVDLEKIGATAEDGVRAWDCSLSTSRSNLDRYTIRGMLRKVKGSKYPPVPDRYWSQE